MRSKKIIIEVSAHHCHISRKDLDIVYGKNYKLTAIKPLSQKGQFAAKELLTIKVGQGIIRNVRILGPERKNTQVEISRTEAYALKIDPPVAECTCPAKNTCIMAEIIGPKGKIKSCAIIIARRHLHCNPALAKKLKLKDNQLISLKTFGKKSITFHNILVRIDPSFTLRLHLDTDEANAAEIKNGDRGEIII